MLHSLLRTTLARRLVYLLCVLMALGGQPLMALEQNIRIVPKAESPEWLETWTDGGTYRAAWKSTAAWSEEAVDGLHHSLDTWWDGSWNEAWVWLESSMTEATGPRDSHPVAAASGTVSASSIVTAQVPVFAAAVNPQDETKDAGESESGLSAEELKKLAETDSLALPDEAPAKAITKAEPMPNVQGLKIGGSSFRPPKELVQQLDAKANLDNIPLIPGLSLLSLPEEPTNADPAAVFSAIGGAYTRVWSYDHCDTANPWKIYDPNDAAATDLTEIDHTNGFWIEATSPVDLPSDGTLPASTTFELCPGWNLIGYPAAQPRSVANALHTIEGQYIRVISYDPAEYDNPWRFHSVGVPHWANNLQEMEPGRGYWVLVTEAATLTIANEGPAPVVEITSPEDLGVVTDFTDVIGTVQSPILESWRLTYERIGETEPVEIASGVAPVAAGGVLGTFDPTLLINGLYELKLEAIDLDGRVVEDAIAIAVEGNMKIGHFTLSFVDLAIPLSGLDIEIIRTYDSRRKDELLDFGYGWSLDIRQGSYQNNRPPGDGWEIVNPGGPFGLPCSQTIETKSHLTTVRLSDQEIYRFRLSLVDTAILLEGCQARAVFEWVDGPLPGSTLEVLGDDRVIYENGSDRLIHQDNLELFEPDDVKLTTRDGRIFHLNLSTGVTHLEDLNGNAVDITVDGITHSSGVGIDFQRDSSGRIQEIVDLRGNSNVYAYDGAGDLVRHTDRAGGETRFSYREHYLRDLHNALGVRAVRTEYDNDGRMVRSIDADGQVIELSHDLENRQEIVTNRLGHSRLLEYDTRGNVVREVDEEGGVTVRTFDGDDNMLTDTDPLGRVTTYTYTAGNDLATVSNGLGETTVFTYNERGQVLTVTDPQEAVTTSAYDYAGNLETTTDALGHVTTFTYDSAGNLRTTTDALGHVNEMTYNSRGDLITETDPLGHVSEYTYNDHGNRETESRTRTLLDGSRESLTTTFVYDDLERVVQTTAADGAMTLASFDPLGRVETHTDALGRVTNMTYNALGQLVRTTFPDETEENQTYDAAGRVEIRTDRGGRATLMTHDKVGRLLTTTYADGAVRRQTYDLAGQILSVTDARGNTTTFAYDNAGRRLSVTNALNEVTVFGHDATGNKVSITDARGYATGFTYDDLGRMVVTTYPDETTTQVGYDALGRRISETDQAGIVTQFGYDALGRLNSVTDALSHVTSYTYDELGNRLTQTDANGHTTSFEYDRLGRQIARILPDDARESMTYYADGTLATHTDFAGDTRTFEYDENQRLVRRAYPDSTEHLFTYTPNGQRETATDSRGVTSYAYDARDRLLEKQDPNGHKLTYTYDVQGNLETLAATVGTESYTTAYGYDALNRQITVTDPQGGVNTLSYDANGNRTSLAHANGVVTTYAYDPLNRLDLLETVDSSASVIQRYAYDLEPTGLRSQIEEADGTTRSYEYDSLYRLTQERVTDRVGELVYEHDFVYDPVGNRLSQSIDESAGSTVVPSTYDDRDRLTVAGATAFGWSSNGNLIGRGADLFKWDFDQHLRSVALEDGTVVEIVYDVDGNRAQARYLSTDRETASVINLVDTRGALSHVVGEASEDRGLTIFVRSEDEILSTFRPDNGDSEYFHADALGSIRSLTDTAGGVVGRFGFTAFGELLQRTGNEDNIYLFAGEPLDPIVGYYYNRARWMDPGTGRFVSVDPAPPSWRDPRSGNRYVYALNSPMNLVDPTGETSQAQSLAALATFAALALASLSIAVTTPWTGAGGQDKGKWKEVVAFRSIRYNSKGKLKISPSTFRIDTDGLSVFEVPDPNAANLPFVISYRGWKIPGKYGRVKSIGAVPVRTVRARYTPWIGWGRGHWSVTFRTRNDDEAKKWLRDLAKPFFAK